jgi:hypothetical protein
VEVNDRAIVLITAVGAIFFLVLSIPLNIFSGLQLGVGNATELAVALYIILTSAVFVIVFRRFRG